MVTSSQSLVRFTIKAIPPLVILGLTLGYILAVINPVPLSDEWRWMQALLIPFIESDINFWQYITGEYSFLGHSHYLTLLFIYTDYQIFGLDYTHMAYIGLIAYLLTWSLLVWYYLALHQYQLNTQGYTCLLLLTLGFASPLSDFPWGLVLFEYLYFLFALALLCLFDLTLRHKFSFYGFLVTFAVSVVFTETIGLMAVLTVLGWSLLHSALKQYPWRKTATLWLTFTLILLAQYLLLGSGIEKRSSFSESAVSMLSNLDSVLQSLFIAFSLPLADQTLLSESSVFQGDYRIWQVLIGIVGLLITLTGMGYCLLGGGLKKSQLPLLLFLFSLVAWGTILLARYQDAGAYIFDARRFARFFTVYYIAAAIGLSLSDKKSGGKAAAALTLLLAVFFSYATVAQHSRAKHVEHYFTNAEQAIKNTPTDKAALANSIPRCKTEPCAETIAFLREHQLSLFK